MIDVEKWMNSLTDKLKMSFGNRLLFVGLQGSYQRQEAHSDSDIDAVVILDTVAMDDLVEYRKVLSTMDANDKACGFISGKQELINWPKHELFQFVHDTRSYYGELTALVPPVGRQDVLNSVKIGASGLYHMCSHTAVHNPTNRDVLKALYKGTFFILQAKYYLQYDEYISTKKELLPLLAGDEQKILAMTINRDTQIQEITSDLDAYFDLLLRWSKGVMNTNDVNFTAPVYLKDVR